jgi:hypothetical protein
MTAEVSAITVENADQMARPFQPQTNVTLRERLGKRVEDASGTDMARVALWLIDKCGYTRHQACVQCNEAFGKPRNSSTIGSALSKLTGRLGTKGAHKHVAVGVTQRAILAAVEPLTDAAYAAGFEAGKAAAQDALAAAIKRLGS